MFFPLKLQSIVNMLLPKILSHTLTKYTRAHANTNVHLQEVRWRAPVPSRCQQAVGDGRVQEPEDWHVRCSRRRPGGIPHVTQSFLEALS